jgi:monothiol glutaredoxin
MDTIEAIKQQISTNPIILYMKGSPNQPQCGFSARSSQALMECGERFAFVDILSNPDIRAKMPEFANWPTFPQLWNARKWRTQNLGSGNCSGSARGVITPGSRIAKPSL